MVSRSFSTLPPLAVPPRFPDRVGGFLEAPTTARCGPPPLDTISRIKNSCKWVKRLPRHVKFNFGPIIRTPLTGSFLQRILSGTVQIRFPNASRGETGPLKRPAPPIASLFSLLRLLLSRRYSVPSLSSFPFRLNDPLSSLIG